MTAFDPCAVADSIGEMEFRELAAFNEGHAGVFWSGPGGPSPWEMHPDCEELLQVLDGEIEIEVLPLGAGPGERTRVATGGCFVVPRGCWHRHFMLAEKTREFYVTPGSTQMSHEADPRETTPDAV